MESYRRTRLRTTAEGPSQPSLGILDHNGRFIARNQRSDELVGKAARPELVAAAAASADGLIRHKTLEGIDVYDAFTHSELSGWTIAVAAPVNTIEASAWLAVGWLVAGLATAPSSIVGVPRVAASPVAFECRLERIVDFGDGPSGSNVVFGTIVLLSALRLSNCPAL